MFPLSGLHSEARYQGKSGLAFLTTVVFLGMTVAIIMILWKG